MQTLSAAGGQIGQFLVRKRTEAELAHSALHDPLTGVANRGLLLDRLGRALARRTRKGAVALLFIDLDAFKLINDGHGHRAGDGSCGRLPPVWTACCGRRTQSPGSAGTSS